MTPTLGHYEIAVYDHPRKPGESWPQYIVRIAELVAGEKLPPPAKDMPEVRLPYRDSA